MELIYFASQLLFSMTKLLKLWCDICWSLCRTNKNILLHMSHELSHTLWTLHLYNLASSNKTVHKVVQFNVISILFQMQLFFSWYLLAHKHLSSESSSSVSLIFTLSDWISGTRNSEGVKIDWMFRKRWCKNKMRLRLSGLGDSSI